MALNRLLIFISTRRHIVSCVNKACYEHSRCLMCITIDSKSQHIQTLDSRISHVKSILSSSCPSILRKDIIQFTCVLNSRLYSFLKASKASKFNSLLSNCPILPATNRTISANSTNLVVTIPPYPTLRDLSSRKVLNLFPARVP